MSGMLRMRRALMRSGDPVAAIVARYVAGGAAALYIPDFNPTRVAASGLSRLYQASGGVNPVTAIAHTIGTVLEESQGAALGSELLATGETVEVGTVTDATYNISTGEGTAVRVDGNNQSGVRFTGLTAGASYLLDVTPGSNGIAVRDGGFALTLVTAATGARRQVICTITTTSIYLTVNGSSGTEAFTVHSLKRVAGLHSLQLTSGSRGTLRQGNAASRFCWRGDGTDDNLLTPLKPAATFTMMAGVEFDAVSDKCIGASVGTNLFSLGTDANGLATAYVGSSVIALSAADVRDIPGVIAISVSGTSYYGFWKPFTGVAEIVSGSFSGSVPTTQALRIGAENDDGTAVAFHAGDNYFDFAIAAQLTAAEMHEVARRASGPLA